MFDFREIALPLCAAALSIAVLAPCPAAFAQAVGEEQQNPSGAAGETVQRVDLAPGASYGASVEFSEKEEDGSPIGQAASLSELVESQKQVSVAMVGCVAALAGCAVASSVLSARERCRKEERQSCRGISGE